uniref:Secreted protein n=1 Tax=Branchiostoma floridae TaxID=7739 RepID=C3ZAB3_BRAFL|eukprot:XP_002594495.1 hypothetical protein BRAFLDRAFT_87687 [Branchiostoma floridae]
MYPCCWLVIRLLMPSWCHRTIYSSANQGAEELSSLLQRRGSKDGTESSQMDPRIDNVMCHALPRGQLWQVERCIQLKGPQAFKTRLILPIWYFRHLTLCPTTFLGVDVIMKLTHSWA